MNLKTLSDFRKKIEIQKIFMNLENVPRFNNCSGIFLKKISIPKNIHSIEYFSHILKCFQIKNKKLTIK